MEAQAGNIIEFVQPWLVIVLAGVMGLWLKDTVASIAAGLKFKMTPAFEPGDIVYLDGEKATIISIGFVTTIFQIDNGRGTIWRYIPNTRIINSRLERIVKHPESDNKHD